jgi:threonine/homoserine efflux transporter RhtA
VLIGGKYAAARDRYWSPIGYAYGLDLLAHETESELSGAIGEFSFRTGSIVNLLVSLAVFGLMLLIPNERWRAICSIGVVIPLAFIAGWLLYVYADFFSGIRSALLAVPIGVLAEHFVKCPLKDRQ